MFEGLDHGTSSSDKLRKFRPDNLGISTVTVKSRKLEDMGSDDFSDSLLICLSGLRIRMFQAALYFFIPELYFQLRCPLAKP